jgi:hypothetical protein
MLGLTRVRRFEIEWIHRQNIRGLNHPELWIWHLNRKKSFSHRGVPKPAEALHTEKDAPEMWLDARRATNSGLVVAVPVAIDRCSSGVDVSWVSTMGACWKPQKCNLQMDNPLQGLPSLWRFGHPKMGRPPNQQAALVNQPWPVLPLGWSLRLVDEKIMHPI